MSFNEIEFPSLPGTYVLWVHVDQPLTLAVGRLGTVTLPAGTYAYVGSAHGPGGLRARLHRHLRAEKPLHWHIDYLTTAAPVVAIGLRVSPEPLECVWARELIARGTVPGAAFRIVRLLMSGAPRRPSQRSDPGSAGGVNAYHHVLTAWR